MIFRNAPARPSLVGTGVALALLLLAGKPAHAWQCNRVRDNANQPKGPALYWPSRTIHYSFNQAGTYQLAPDDAFNTVRQAFNNWQTSALRPEEPAGCPNHLVDPNFTDTDVTFVEDSVTDQDFAGYSVLNPSSNKNVVMFRDHDWAYPLTGEDTADYMSMTTVTYNKLSGEILDADIEFNSFGYRFTVDDDNVVYDLLNVATHEVGHLLGFGHADDANATMYKTANYGELQKRQLACDDVAALWFRFPAGAQTQTCPAGNVTEQCGMCAPSTGLSLSPTVTVRRAHDGHGGCQCQSAQAAEAAGLAASGLLLRRVIRRRRQTPRGLSPARDRW